MIYTVTLNPALDKTVVINAFAVDTVNRISSIRTDPGGKGINVSKVLLKLGTASTAFAILGGSSGQLIDSMLDTLGVDREILFTPNETRTNLKVRDPELGTNTDINEPGDPIPEGTLETLLERLTGRIAEGDIVVLSGSLPKGAPADTYRTWTEACRAAGAHVCLDADGALLRSGLEGIPSMIKPNTAELERLCGRPLPTDADRANAAREIIDSGVGTVIVSMGGEGMLLVTGDLILRADGLKVPVGSTVGAGDSVVAAYAHALQNGLTAEETLRLCTAVSAANVMCSGTQAAEPEAVAELLPLVTIKEMN